MRLTSKRNDRISTEGIRTGMKDEDVIYLNRRTNTPHLQIFSAEEMESEPEDRTYWCAECKSKLDYLKGSDTIWRCDNCMVYYDTKIQDTPLKDITESKLSPYAGLMHYPQFDDNDSNPFMESINLNNNKDLETRTQKDQRILTIHVKGSFTDAVKAGVLSSRKQPEEDDY